MMKPEYNTEGTIIMKISTALFASILSICLTAGYVSGQISFPDGSVQTTAFDSPVVASADRFNFTTNVNITGLPVGLGMALSPVVPAGQELVILQINGSSSNKYTSRLPSPDELTNPIDIAYPYTVVSINFPDGAVVIDEGRQLWGTDDYNGYLYPCQVLGYYRTK